MKSRLSTAGSINRLGINLNPASNWTAQSSACRLGPNSADGHKTKKGNGHTGSFPSFHFVERPARFESTKGGFEEQESWNSKMV